MSRMRTGLAAVAAGLLVLGCGAAAPQASPTTPAESPAAASPTQATLPTEAPVATGTPLQTESATPTPEAPTPTDGTAPGTIAPDQPLEDLFPDELGGRQLEVQSATGEAILTLMGETEPDDLNEFLGDMGASIDQMSVAFAFSFGPGATADEFTGVTLFAYRIRGVQGSQMLTRLAEMVREDAEDAELGTATISGKTVTTVREQDADEDATAYLYPVGDVVFMAGGTPSLVEEAFAKLP
jgi:hypothetical protein